jgi:hypothetical protein
MIKAKAIKLANEYNLSNLLTVNDPNIWLFVAKGYKGAWAVEKYKLINYEWKLNKVISEYPESVK